MTRKTDTLTYERAIEILRYEPETGVLERRLDNGKWRACGGKPNHSSGYSQVRVDGKRYLAHRLVWLLTYGEWPENEIDHLDRDRMNNKINNLRATTRSENMHNLRMNKNNSSGYTGVSLFKRDKKYRAQIRINDKVIHLGLYSTASEAFTAHMLAKIQYHPTALSPNNIYVSLLWQDNRNPPECPTITSNTVWYTNILLKDNNACNHILVLSGGGYSLHSYRIYTLGCFREIFHEKRAYNIS